MNTEETSVVEEKEIEKEEIPVGKTLDEIFFQKNIPLIDLIETYQGEGPNCGRKMVLARFKYCNKLCPFCDTQKMMQDLTSTKYSLKDIAIMLKSSPNLMITGGEPTIDKKLNNEPYSQFECTEYMLKYLDYDFLDIETNGLNLIKLTEIADLTSFYQGKKINISWSPKFISKADYCYNMENVIQLNERNFENCKPIIKIVIGDGLDEYKSFVYDAVLNHHFDNNRVYLMPKGTTLDEINESMKMVLDVASDLSCNVSSRLHVIHNFK